MYWNYRVPGIRIGEFVNSTSPLKSQCLTSKVIDRIVNFEFYCGPPNLDKLPVEYFQLFEAMVRNTWYNSAPGRLR
ncbi:hypothetical protein AVEN_125918-1, partial [Araneus ventricosus]